MKRTSLLILTAAIIVLFAPLCKAQTMYDMKDEAGRKYEQADKEMTRIYKLAMASCDAPGKEKLRKAQRAWIKYRDSCCEAEASLFEGGTMYGLVYTNCMIDLTIERTKRLRVYDPENSWK